MVALPPFSLLPQRLRERIIARRVVLLHFVALSCFYGVVLAVAAYEGVVYIHSGTGIIQNPPFLAHVVCAVSSIWLPIAILTRIARTADSAVADTVLATFLRFVEVSKTKVVLFAVAVLVGLASLAYTIYLSLYPTENIYDSIQHPLTFLMYLLLRIYLYLICYPFMISGCVINTYYLFRALRSSSVVYRPFHEDEMGGLRKYLRAVDSPVYLVQCLTVLVGATNYLGWGGMFAVPIMFSIAAPAVVTGFAFILFFDFHALLSSKKEKEVQAVRQQQMELYEEAKRLDPHSPERLELLRRIETMDAVVDAIRKGRENGWKKYLLNMIVAVIGQLGKPLIAYLTSHIQFVK
jgi:hypothetical protein